MHCLLCIYLIHTIFKINLNISDSCFMEFKLNILHINIIHTDLELNNVFVVGFRLFVKRQLWLTRCLNRVTSHFTCLTCDVVAVVAQYLHFNMTLLLTLLFLLTITTSSLQQRCDQHFINNVMDFILDQFAAKYPDSVELPDVTKSFLLNSIVFELGFGSVSGLSTIRRVGDMELDMRDGHMDVALAVQFDNLTIAYDMYRIQALAIQRTGSLKTSVMDNLIRVSASMQDNSPCLIDVERIQLLHLGDFHVDLNSSCKICNKLANWISNKILNFFKTIVRYLVEYKIDSVLRTALSDGKNNLVCRNHNFVNWLCGKLKTFPINSFVYLLLFNKMLYYLRPKACDGLSKD